MAKQICGVTVASTGRFRLPDRFPSLLGKGLGRKDFVFGQFGENFTVDGLSDDEVCIGDRYRIGGAMFEVTQLRVTCYRVGIRIDEPRMPVLLVEHHRPGFYFRVLEEGEVGAGDDIVKVADGAEHMSVDIGRQETAAKSVEAAVKHFGTIDVLVNNAGIFRTKPFTDFTRRD